MFQKKHSRLRTSTPNNLPTYSMVATLLFYSLQLGAAAHIGYKARTDGDCGEDNNGWSKITSVAACEEAATAMGWPYMQATVTPQRIMGCSKWSESELNFNPSETSVYDCTSMDGCICALECAAGEEYDSNSQSCIVNPARIGYKARADGNCGDDGGGWSRITSSAACGAAAVSMGWPDTTATATPSAMGQYETVGCFLHGTVNGLNFNPAETSVYDCGDNMGGCVCTLECAAGEEYDLTSSSCVSVTMTCGTGTTVQGLECVSVTMTCGTGTTAQGLECVPVLVNVSFADYRELYNDNGGCGQQAGNVCATGLNTITWACATT
jgi:hypothetical protein